MKRTVKLSVCLALCVMMILGSLAAAPVYAASNCIRFDASEWSNYSIIYCHIWERGGDSFFPWQSRKEACKKVDGNIYEYELSVLDNSTTVEGGLQSGKDYCVIFSAMRADFSPARITALSSALTQAFRPTIQPSLRLA